VLSPGDMTAVAIIGALRRVDGLTKGREDWTGAPPAERWTRDVEGAGGEFAAARVLNLFWSGTVGTVTAPGDVGRIQVRQAHALDSGLIVRDADPPGACYVLVVGMMPVYYVVGWLWGADAPARGTRRAPHGRPAATFVPQAALEPLATCPGGRAGRP